MNRFAGETFFIRQFFTFSKLKIFIICQKVHLFCCRLFFFFLGPEVISLLRERTEKSNRFFCGRGRKLRIEKRL